MDLKQIVTVDNIERQYHDDILSLISITTLLVLLLLLLLLIIIQFIIIISV